MLISTDEYGVGGVWTVLPILRALKRCTGPYLFVQGVKLKPQYSKNLACSSALVTTGFRGSH